MAISIRVNAEAWERIFGDKPEDAALGISEPVACTCATPCAECLDDSGLCVVDCGCVEGEQS